MNWKLFGKKLETAGSYLGTVGATNVIATYGFPDGTAKAVAMYITVAAFGCAVFGHLVQIFADDDGILDDVKKIGTTMFAVALIGCAGCETATPTRKKAEDVERTARKVAYQNLSDQYDAQEKANLINYTKRIDLELKSDLRTLAYEVKLNPNKWQEPTAVAEETARLQALHDQKIATYKEDSVAKFRALKEKNEAVNLGIANQIEAALKSPKPQPPLNQSNEILNATGKTQTTPLIQE